MTTDLGTLLTALYVLVDDHVMEPGPRRPGHPKRLSDAELVSLAVAQVLPGARSEHHWLRLCHGRPGSLFPYLPKQPGYHKRTKAAAPLTCPTMLCLATLCPSWADGPRLLDATPVPGGTCRQTVRRSELAGLAHYGYCAAHSRWYWGLKLYLITTAGGMPAAWCLADPKNRRAGGRRRPARSRPRHRGAERGHDRPGGQGPGRAGTRAVRRRGGQGAAGPAGRKDERHRYGNLGGMRQWAESVYDTAKDQLSLERHGARTAVGVFARIAQRLLAMAACIWRNWSVRTTDLRSLIAYDH